MRKQQSHVTIFVVLDLFVRLSLMDAWLAQLKEEKLVCVGP